MFGLYRYVGSCNMNLQYPRYHCTNPMLLHVDNSDFPSVVEQSQQGPDSSCYTLLAVIPSSVMCLISCACQLASCNMGISCGIFLSLISVSLCSPCPSLLQQQQPLGLCSPFFIPGVFSLSPGIACLCAPWDSLSGFSGSDWAGAFWGSLSGFELATFC